MLPAQKWFPIRTDRLLLREFTVGDEDAIHEYGGDALVSQFATWGPNSREDTHAKLIERLDEQLVWPRSEVTLALELLRERKVIGAIRLGISDQENDTADFGYVVNRRYWNQGYATEASHAILHVAFHTLNLHRVWASCDTRNIASWRVLEKLGMRREGHFRSDVFQKGEWRDSYVYGLLCSEFDAARCSMP